jgi:hypothetical protein
MNTIRKIAALFMLIAASAPVILSVVFLAGSILIRVEMEEKMKSENISVVDISVKDFRWYKENREILVNGVLFDVRDIEREGDMLHISGLFDDRESSLVVQLINIAEQNEKEPEPDNLIVQVCLGVIAELKSSDLFQCPLPGQPTPLPVVFSRSNYTSHILNIFSPPPEG